jgi:hypothetical protein
MQFVSAPGPMGELLVQQAPAIYLPQVAENNTPQPQDAAGEYLL